MFVVPVFINSQNRCIKSVCIVYYTLSFFFSFFLPRSFRYPKCKVEIVLGIESISALFQLLRECAVLSSSKQSNKASTLFSSCEFSQPLIRHGELMHFPLPYYCPQLLPKLWVSLLAFNFNFIMHIDTHKKNNSHFSEINSRLKYRDLPNFPCIKLKWKSINIRHSLPNTNTCSSPLSKTMYLHNTSIFF